uniref:p53 and DNA damage regulated 1 n=1 Tax=Molossus molossus TaxID=27622 RepID=A0A7J8HIF4_MOLMO|nr:p53 and DNA damage regulated 1 [Molossus molossus]
MLSPEAERVLQYLVEVEELAEAVLADKRQIVDLDAKRNQNREGLRALQKDLSLSGKSRLPQYCPEGLFSFPSKAFALFLIETRQEATGM